MKPGTTPLVAHFKISSALCPQSDKEVDYMSRVPYSSVMSSLVYAIVSSRPDLAYAISKCMAKPGKKHWKAVEYKHVYTMISLDIFVIHTTTLDNYSQLGLSH